MIKKIIIFSFFCLISISLFAVFFGLSSNDAMALTTEKIDYNAHSSSYPTIRINQSNDRYSIVFYDNNLKRIKYGYEDANGQFYYQTIEPDSSYDLVSTYQSGYALALSTSFDLDGQGYAHITYSDATNYYLHYAYQDASGWHYEIIDDSNVPVYYSSVAIDNNNYPHVVYANRPDKAGYQSLLYAYKDISGWHQEIIHENYQSNVPTQNPDPIMFSIALDSSDYAHVSYFKDYADLYYAYKDISGWHYESVDTVGRAGASNSIAVDSLNRPHISYLDLTNYDLKYALKDSGAWTKEIVDSSVANTGWSTSIITDSSSRPHISYIDYTNQDLKYTYKDLGVWNPVTVSTDTYYSYPTSIDLASTGLPQIAYSNSGYFLRAHYDGAIWTNVSYQYQTPGYRSKIAVDSNNYAHVVSPNGNRLNYTYENAYGWNEAVIDSSTNINSYIQYSSIALDQNNYSHISYYDSINADLKYAYQDASGWHTETAVSAGNVGTHNSIAIDQDGYPHISYYNASTGYIVHAYKDGTGWHTENIGSTSYTVSTSDNDYTTSIVINSANYPCVSYYSFSIADLIYAYKDGTGWHTETVDSGGDVGKRASLDLDSSNYPHIAYYDATNSKVKYAYKDIDGWHAQFVDTNVSYGMDITLKLDSQNNSLLAYYNLNTDLPAFAYNSGSWIIQNINNITKFGVYPSLALDSDNTIHLSGQTSFYSGTIYHIFGSAPTSTSIAINSGASRTNTTAVTLALSASSDAYQMMVSESATFVGASWETYATSKNFTLSSGDGTKTVYVKYRDKLLSESTGISSTIILDETAPTVTSAIAVPNPAKPGNVTVSLQFSEDMDTTVSPTVNITGLVSSPYAVTQSSFIGNTWTGTFNLLDDNEITTAVISVAGAKDLAGNTMLADSSAGTFEVNTIAPYLTSIIVNPNPAIPGTAGVILYFSQAMDTTVTPTVTINGLASSYTVSQNIYGSTIWYGTFTLNPDNEDTTATISVTGAKDIAGNTMLPDLSASTFQVESILPTISSISYTPNPAQAGLVTVTIVFSENMLTTALPVVEITGLRTENYTLTQTSYSGKTWTGNIVLDSSYTNTSGYISVRNAKDLAGNTMISQPEAMTFTALNSMATNFNQTLNLEQTNLLRTYQDLGQDIKVYFYEKPSNSTGLYLTLIRKNKKYSSKHFIKEKLYPAYLNLKSNIKNIRKTTFKITFHYKSKKLKKNKLKEKNLRLFIKDRDNKWRGPFTIYQNKEKNILKFKIRNYYLKPGLAFLTKNTKSNRNYAPFFKFSNISKIKFVIADKDAFKQ